jgi:hypothetical protein
MELLEALGQIDRLEKQNLETSVSQREEGGSMRLPIEK